MNTITLTRSNLHELSGSPGKCGFTREQIELLGFSWPPAKGWLSSLIGKEIALDLYEQVRTKCRKKWKDMERAKFLVNAAKQGHVIPHTNNPNVPLNSDEVWSLVKLSRELLGWIVTNDKSGSYSANQVEIAAKTIAKVVIQLPPF